jgi:DNA modification methylase
VGEVVGKFSEDLTGLLIPVADLVEDPTNARLHGPDNMEAICSSLDLFGQQKPVVYWLDPDGRRVVKAGNGTLRGVKKLGWSHIAAARFEGDARSVKAFAIADNRSAELAHWDVNVLQTQMEELADWQPAEGVEWKPEAVGFDPVTLDTMVKRETVKKAAEPAPSEERREDEEAPEPAPVAEVSSGISVNVGDLWQLGNHRLLCGDCRAPDVVERLMGGQKAALLHADPPYGMGKESDGVANDNLYAAKLDQFQIEWWRAARPHLIDNASVYIWGNAPDLWRFWFGPMTTDAKDVLSLRNEIVWDKGANPGQLSPDMRRYAPATERALFFMLGQQEIGNVNGDSYWEGWEPLRQALNQEMQKAGWDHKAVAKITGVTPRMALHWFERSQWIFIAEKHYNALAAAAKAAGSDAFSYRFADVAAIHRKLAESYRAEVTDKFYDARSYFDNTHDNMNDVWSFPRVVGEERWGHATPKPVAMIGRAVKSSAPEGAIVLEPFVGSGSTLIACEQTGRRCYGTEIEPKFVAATIARWQQATGKTARRLDAGGRVE